jgi:hypothetical protein
MDSNDLKQMRIGWNRQIRKELYEIAQDHADKDLMVRLLDDLFMSDEDFEVKMRGL